MTTYSKTIKIIPILAILGSSIFASGDFKMKGFTNTTFPLDVCEKIETLTGEKVIYSDINCYTESKSAIVEWNDDTTLNKITLKSKAVDSIFDVEYVNSGTFITNFKNGYVWANDIECSDTLRGNSVDNVCKKTDVPNGWYLHYSWIDENGKKSVDKNMIIEFFDKGTKRLVDRKRDEIMEAERAIKAAEAQKIAKTKEAKMVAKAAHTNKAKVTDLKYLFNAINNGNSQYRNKKIKSGIVNMRISDTCMMKDVKENDNSTSRVVIICDAPEGKELYIFSDNEDFAENLEIGETFDFNGRVKSVDIGEQGQTIVQIDKD